MVIYQILKIDNNGDDIEYSLICRLNLSLEAGVLMPLNKC